MDGQPTPKKWLDWDSRKKLIESLPPRVYPLLLCEYAVSVLPMWVQVYPHDKRPHRSIVARLRWCLELDRARAAEAAWAAEAAGAARAAEAAEAAWAAWAAGTAGAAWAAGAAGAARAAGAAWAAQWRWMYAAYLAACPVLWAGEWNTSTVKSLAYIAFRRRDWSIMPILADALQDAGCVNEKLLKRLRGPTSLFTRADVALWCPMGLGD